MTRSSCIAHKTSQQMTIIREDYLWMCDGNHCAASLLNVFEYWMNYKINHHEQVQIENKIAAVGAVPLLVDDMWVYKTAENLKDELLGLFADTKITAAVKLLKKKGFIETRNNPAYGWDRTLQYLFKAEAVQQAVNISDAYTILKNKVSKPYKKRIKVVKETDERLKNKEAIPETTSEFTSETTPKSYNTFVPNGTDGTQSVVVKTSDESEIPVATTIEETSTATANVAIPSTPGSAAPPSPIKPKRVNPAEAWRNELLACFNLTPNTVTKTADGGYWKVAVELKQIQFPVEAIKPLHKWLVDKKWSSLSVNAMAKYGGEYLVVWNRLHPPVVISDEVDDGPTEPVENPVLFGGQHVNAA